MLEGLGVSVNRATTSSEGNPEERPEIGVVAFSFGQRSVEPSPGNIALARAAKRAVKQQTRPVYLFAQWEVAKGLEQLGMPADAVAFPPVDGHYLDTEEVWSAAREQFSHAGIKTVVPVAQPFLHLRKVRHLVKSDGFEVARFRPGRISFDGTKANRQEWTRSRVGLVWYSINQLLSGRRGPKAKPYS